MTKFYAFPVVIWVALFASSATAQVRCHEVDAVAIELFQRTICFRGLGETQLRILLEDDQLARRRPQWQFPDLFDRSRIGAERPTFTPSHPISEYWPSGATYVRISQGGLRERPEGLPLAPDFPNMFLERRNPRSFAYWPTDLTFRNSHNVFITCFPANFSWQVAEDTEQCLVYLDAGDLRVSLLVLTAEHWGGAEGWPRFSNNYDPVAWQNAINQVDAFLSIAMAEPSDG